MASIFISYSRKNKEFCKRLADELKTRDIEPWVDWNDIPPVVDWMQEIEKGIEEADAFLAIITPDWVVSKVCMDELNIAIKNGKRLIPVVAVDVKGDAVPAKLAHLNYIFFRESDDFSSAMQTLVTALTTDYDWVQTHRRLQVKALEWQRQQSSSLLLRGDSLRRTEELLATSSEKNPEPTDLQRQFILESRRAETKARNYLMVAAGAAVVVLTIALLFSIYQMRVSDARRIAAEAQTAVAENEYRLGALLSLASKAIKPTDEANQALTRSLFIPAAHGQTFSTDVQNNFIQSNVHTFATWVGRDTFVYATENGDLWVWDVNKQDYISVPDLQKLNISINSLAGSPDGFLAVGGNNGEIVIWDMKTKREIPFGESVATEGKIKALAWSTDNQLATALADGTVIIWDPSSKKITSLPNEEKTINALAWSSDNQLAIGFDDGQITIWDPGFKMERTLGVESKVLCLAWSSDGKLAAGTDDKYIAVWNIQDLETPPLILKGNKDNVFSVAWSDQGQLASGSRDKTIILWDVEEQKIDRVLSGHTDAVENVSWSATGSIISSGQDGIVILWDLSDDNLARSWKESIGEIHSVAWASDGRFSYGGEDDTAVVIDPLNLPVHLSVQGGLNSLAWSIKGQLAAGTYNNGVLVWQPDSINKSQYQALPIASSVQSVAWAPDGRLAAGLFDNQVKVWDVNLQETTSSPISVESAVNSVAWSQENLLAAGLDDAKVIVWNVESGEEQILSGHSDVVRSVAWSTDGRLASGSEDGNVIIWNLSNSNIEKKLNAHSPITTIAWSADGRLASGTTDGKIILWDVNSGIEIKTHHKNNIEITSVSWLENGDLLSGAVSGEVDYYPASVNLSDFECKHLVSNFSGDEWLQYVGTIYTYKPACNNLAAPDFGSWLDLNYLKYTIQGRWLVIISALFGVTVLWSLIKMSTAV